MNTAPVNFFFFKNYFILLDDSDFGRGDEVEPICSRQKCHPRSGLILCAARSASHVR